MTYLLDTHLLLWAAVTPTRLSRGARRLLESREDAFLFSVASIWETAIKHGLGRAEFQVEPTLLRQQLFRGGYEEVSITSEHAIVAGALPLFHGDPFDRMLVAQARVEGVVLLTADATLARYGAPVKLV